MECRLLEVGDVLFCKGVNAKGDATIDKITIESVHGDVATAENRWQIWRPILNGRVHDYRGEDNCFGYSTLHTETTELEREYVSQNLAATIATTDFKALPSDTVRKIYEILQKENV